MNLSLKARLMLWACIFIPLTLIFTGVMLTERFSDRREEEFQDSMEVHLRKLLAFLNESDGKLTLSDTMDDPGFMQPYSKLYWQINMGNIAIFRSRSLSSQILPAKLGV